MPRLLSPQPRDGRAEAHSPSLTMNLITVLAFPPPPPYTLPSDDDIIYERSLNLNDGKLSGH